MAHGTPDWGVTAGAVTTYQLTDLAEVAARLGSIVTFDRRGDVIWLEDWEGGFNKWLVGVSGKDANVGLSVARSWGGRYCARLVAGSTDDAAASITHDLPFPTLSGMGVEFKFDLALPFTYVDFGLDVDDGTNVAQYRVRYVDSTAQLQYQDHEGHWVVIATDNSPLGSLLQFNTLKLVADGVNGEYARAILNSRTYSLSGIAARAVGSDDGPKMQIFVDFRGLAGANSRLYQDGVIATQNEPL